MSFETREIETQGFLPGHYDAKYHAVVSGAGSVTVNAVYGDRWFPRSVSEIFDGIYAAKLVKGAGVLDMNALYAKAVSMLEDEAWWIKQASRQAEFKHCDMGVLHHVPTQAIEFRMLSASGEQVVNRSIDMINLYDYPLCEDELNVLYRLVMSIVRSGAIARLERLDQILVTPSTGNEQYIYVTPENIVLGRDVLNYDESAEGYDPSRGVVTFNQLLDTIATAFSEGPRVPIAAVELLEIHGYEQTLPIPIEVIFSAIDTAS